MSRVSANLTPLLCVYDSRGRMVDSKAGGASVTVSVSVTVGERYTVLVGDGKDGTRTGGYRLTLAKG
jgi:hypothetical protein